VEEISDAAPRSPTAGASGRVRDERACDHCGLPLGPRPLDGEVEGQALRFCCAGCWLAMQVTRARGDAGGAAAILVRLGLAVFFAMNVMMLSAPSYVPHVYGDGAAAVDGPLFAPLRWLAALFSLPVLFLLGGPVARSALAGVRARRPGSDALIAIGVLAAYALSWANLLQDRTAVYFDTGAVLLVLVTLGRYLEARARADAAAAVRSDLSAVAATARVARDGGWQDVASADVRPGDLLEVRPGGAIPTDGVVVDGRAGVDESMLTGEHRLVVKEIGADVAGGTCSVDGTLRIRATAPAGESAAARIAALLAAAQRERSRAERVADAAAAVLTPAMIAVALAAGAWWSARAGIDRGTLVAISVLVVACPCALGIATPVAMWVALQAAARRGVVVRSALVLERLAAVRAVLFDKTGTVTDPTPRVTGVDVAPGNDIRPDDLLARCAALEAGIPHPLARAIVRAAGERGLAPLADEARDVRIVPGRGVEGRVGDRRIAAGSERLAEERAAPAARAALADWATASASRPGRAAESAVLVLEDGRFLGAIRLSEAIRPEAGDAVAALRSSGASVGLLTGDLSADAVAPEPFRHAEVAFGLAPEAKVARIAQLRAERGRTAAAGAIAMVGDGINDAPALAAADVGIAVSGASDLARLTADVAVLGGDLRAVPWLLAHARRARAVARENLAWAFGYNAVAVALAAAGSLTPLVASLAMIASSAAVVANARRLARGSSGLTERAARARGCDRLGDERGWRAPAPAA